MQCNVMQWDELSPASAPLNSAARPSPLHSAEGIREPCLKSPHVVGRGDVICYRILHLPWRLPKRSRPVNAVYKHRRRRVRSLPERKRIAILRIFKSKYHHKHTLRLEKLSLHINRHLRRHHGYRSFSL